MAPTIPSHPAARRARMTAGGRRARALAALAAAVAIAAGAQTASPTAHRLLVPRGGPALDLRAADGTLPAPRLTPLQAAMTQAFPEIGANADGSDVWPCYGRATPNPNCPTVGNPQRQLPLGAIVTGKPSYSFALRNDDIFGFGNGNGIGCDAFINGSTGLAPAQYRPCGQITTFFEDNTGDTEADLLQRVRVTQGDRVIYDSGIVDFGPAGPIPYPVDVELYYDVNFGHWPGAETGPNNGNCTPDINYPLAAPAFPGVIYQVAAGSTCSRPVAGKAHVHTRTVLATPRYHRVTGARCTDRGVASPCYLVSWVGKHEIVQDWDVFLR